MKLAGCNTMTVGIFSWVMIEPVEGQFEFGWLDTVMDRLYDNGIYVVLATPSGAKPAWLSRAYPEVRRVTIDGHRERHGRRHNHCRTSPKYREKCQIINGKLAERYKDHPALIVWHVSNEFDGNDCHCDLCHNAFREWLKKRYDNDINKLNEKYWNTFWSRNYPDWDYIEPTDTSTRTLLLDWERFKTAQTVDFYLAEAKPLKEITPDIPVTTNLMTGSRTLDVWEFSRSLDVIAWDNYPDWHETDDEHAEAARTALMHDVNRTHTGGRPYMMMESCPSIPTRGIIKKRKLPGMNLLSSLQAVAHGSDTVQYFQWRKGRGGPEKFHGAIVDHAGSEHTREFQEVADVGRALAKLDDIVGTTVEPKVAVVEDWENDWAINSSAKEHLGQNVKYRKECVAHYAPFWEAGVPVDVIDMSCPLEKYTLVVLPMVFMLRPGFAERLRSFVENGGTAVMTYWSAVVDENDLCYLGGIPGDGLRDVFGVREEESQNYYPDETVKITMEQGNPLGIEGEFTAVDTCSVIHTEGSTVLARYASDYFAGSPAVTVNQYGKGKAYYIASRNEQDFLLRFYNSLIADLSIDRVIDTDLPKGVTAQMRTDGQTKFIFLMNFNQHDEQVALDAEYTDMLTEQSVSGTVTLGPYGVMVMRK
jgi:beta-galactosidase